MIRQTLYIILSVLPFACTPSKVPMPVLSNTSNLLSMQHDSLVFSSSVKNWNATLLSFTQPIPMQVKYIKNGFILYPKHRKGGTEGKSELVLTHKGQSFYYELILKNKPPDLIYTKDYRSPKTVNPDSSLQQQSIVHRFDQWRNLHQLQNNSSYFSELQITLPARSGVYRAQKENAISAFYIQPGSALSIPIQAVYDQKEKLFIASAGPLKDKHNNLIANGTMVTFEYHDDLHFFITEKAVLNGYATTLIRTQKGKSYKLTASIQKTVSNTIEIYPQ